MTADEPVEAGEFVCPGCKRPVRLQLLPGAEVPRVGDPPESFPRADWLHEDGTKQCDWTYTP